MASALIDSILVDNYREFFNLQLTGSITCFMTILLFVMIMFATTAAQFYLIIFLGITVLSCSLTVVALSTRGKKDLDEYFDKQGQEMEFQIQQTQNTT
jgi:hypothetical protein